MSPMLRMRDEVRALRTSVTDEANRISRLSSTDRIFFMNTSDSKGLVQQQPEPVPTGSSMATGMSALGNIEPFDESVSDWKTYEQRITSYLKVNKISPELEVDAFITLIGPKTYRLLQDLVSPSEPTSKPLDELKSALRTHLSPQPSVIAERAKFHVRKQKEGETISEFAAALKHLAQTCKFGATLEEVMRDRFVTGLSRIDIQKCLFAEDESLTLKRALEKALSLEQASKNATDCHSDMSANQQIQRLRSEGKNFPSKHKQRRGGYRCGGEGHESKDCRYRNFACFKCGKRGHIQAACMSKVKELRFPKAKSVKPIRNLSSENHEDSFSHLRALKGTASPICFDMTVEGQLLKMELDTGAAVSVVSENVYKELLQHKTLEHTDVVLRTYTEEATKPLGVVVVNVDYKSKHYSLPLHVLDKSGPSLIGRDWLRHIRLDWSVLHKLNAVENSKASCTEAAKRLFSKYSQLFNNELGCIKGEKVQLRLKQEEKPKFLKARPVPFALRPKVEKELKAMEEMGIISPVMTSDFATPVVPVVKSNGQVRLCGDYKVTINPLLESVQYPLPRIDDLLADLAGGVKFSRIDLSRAYQQIEVDEDSLDCLTINTTLGMYRVNRLPFGITTAPALFQKVMDTMLKGLRGVTCYLDDILITGTSEQEHLENLEAVLKVLVQRGVRVRPEKCEFFKESLEYLGHEIDSTSIRPSADKVKALLFAPHPTDKKQLKSFIGLINYYGKFLPRLSTVLHPLYRLLQEKVTWLWDLECQRAYSQVKDLLASSAVLAHYDPDKPVQLSCDASPYGLGAVFSHVYDDGSTRPVAYASRTLSDSEKNYSQLEKEALVFGVKKFHFYLYGRKFVLVTDHKPLQCIFGSKKGIPTIAAARIQRWAISLSAYDYIIKHCSSEENSAPDYFSRLPLQTTRQNFRDEVDSFFTLWLDTLPVTSKDIARETTKDPLLSRVLEHTMIGWAAEIKDPSLKPFFQRRNELSVQQRCLMWGLRLVIPLKLRNRILDELHSSHPGVIRMKELARSFIWWPHIDTDIETRVRNCDDCQRHRNEPAAAPVHPWEWPTRPWERIHVDFAGPFQHHNFLVVMDAHSKWPEVWPMSSTSTSATVENLRDCFSRYGIPETIVSDNGPQFRSEEFKSFLRNNGVRHITSAPYHPSTNGLVERFIQSLKQSLKKNPTIQIHCVSPACKVSMAQACEKQEPGHPSLCSEDDLASLPHRNCQRLQVPKILTGVLRRISALPVKAQHFMSLSVSTALLIAVTIRVGKLAQAAHPEL
ncbi:uncharacterized protein K02A2.6-like [Ornithodoros turicata]|uniref:uncharacterized protein K02A2.6-like n=1 Tax=Ornithodoros turicata TaxID=34597 RepID=UPI00313916CC